MTVCVCLGSLGKAAVEAKKKMRLPRYLDGSIHSTRHNHSTRELHPCVRMQLIKRERDSIDFLERVHKLVHLMKMHWCACAIKGDGIPCSLLHPINTHHLSDITIIEVVGALLRTLICPWARRDPPVCHPSSSFPHVQQVPRSELPPHPCAWPFRTSINQRE